MKGHGQPEEEEMLEIGTFQRRPTQQPYYDQAGMQSPYQYPPHYHQPQQQQQQQQQYFGEDYAAPHQPYVEEFPSRPARSNQRASRPMPPSRPTSSYREEYGSSPGWPASIAGRSDMGTLVDSAAGSRTSFRSYKTGRMTPENYPYPSPRYPASSFVDSGPSTPVVSGKPVVAM